jgi:hypothetical protein
MAKKLDSLDWIPELLPKNYIRKPMFGGFAFYVDSKIVLVLFENEGDRTHRGKEYSYDLWNGCLFPTERQFHSEILKKFPQLISHPVLPKWLYLPSQTEDFESIVEDVLKFIRARSSLFGVVPALKKVKKEPSKKVEAIDTRIPKMFAEDPKPIRLGKAHKITDLKNLGPSSEKEFHKAGIQTADQFIKMGWKKAFQKLTVVNPKNRHSIFAYALIGALKNVQWNQIPEEDKLEARTFAQSLKPVKKSKKVGKKKTPAKRKLS